MNGVHVSRVIEKLVHDLPLKLLIRSHFDAFTLKFIREGIHFADVSLVQLKLPYFFSQGLYLKNFFILLCELVL